MNKKELSTLIIVLVILVLSILLFINVISNKNRVSSENKINIYNEELEEETKNKEIINNVYKKGGTSLKDGELNLYNPTDIE